MEIINLVGNVTGKNILLLQGPMGNFFNTLDHKFMHFGANTFRIGLNAGDEFFADANHYTPFKGKVDEWNSFIFHFYKEHSIDMIFSLGDCRFYQSEAIKVAKKNNIEVFIFEEGYIRPNFITLEKNGVNANSSLPRERIFYDTLKYKNPINCDNEDIKKIGNTYKYMAKQAIYYYFFGNIFFFKYPYYKHHRIFFIVTEFFYGIRNYLRKQKYKWQERDAEQLYKTTLSKKYYFVALQTYEDFQVSSHSDYSSIEEFIEEIMISFSKYAKEETFLVLKHHPMDRGKKNYKKFIESKAKILNISKRVKVIYDLHLPTLLKNAIATVTINSTVGISSLYHKIPTFCTGRSFYDIKGLTTSAEGITLNDFWINYKEVDSELFYKFQCYLIKNTQVNSSFYI
jgi:capsular polysaccharide export protein